MNHVAKCIDCIDVPSSHGITSYLLMPDSHYKPAAQDNIYLTAHWATTSHNKATTVDLFHHILAGMRSVVHSCPLDVPLIFSTVLVLPAWVARSLRVKVAASTLVSRRMKVFPVQLARMLVAQTQALPQTAWTLQLHTPAALMPLAPSGTGEVRCSGICCSNGA